MRLTDLYYFHNSSYVHYSFQMSHLKNNTYVCYGVIISFHSVAEVWGSYFSEGTASTISPHTTSFYISFALRSVDLVCSVCFYNHHTTIGFLFSYQLGFVGMMKELFFPSLFVKPFYSINLTNLLHNNVDLYCSVLSK